MNNEENNNVEEVIAPDDMQESNVIFLNDNNEVLKMEVDENGKFMFVNSAGIVSHQINIMFQIQEKEIDNLQQELSQIMNILKDDDQSSAAPIDIEVLGNNNLMIENQNE